ncbi:MAG: hypothetical protein RML36_02170 [Anaerolineae bacterium]|nr:hypothetical protein [Anaerolineae bacterium]MDW8098274.1 hypothetical protein [Anaerolineae bacterium]
MDRWLRAALLVIGGLSLLTERPGGWLIALAAGTLLIGHLAINIWAGRNAYVEFIADRSLAPLPSSDQTKLQPQDKVEVRATGLFEVEGRSQFFAELQAYFRTFATREHAVMALVPRSRFLWIGQWPEHELGMWYIFFSPQQVISLEPGALIFHGALRPALRVIYRAQRGLERIYLSFASEEDRRRVWIDIAHDAALRAQDEISQTDGIATPHGLRCYGGQISSDVERGA